MNSDSKADLLFCPKLFRAVLCWLERLGVPQRDRDDVAGQVWYSAWRSWRTFDPERSRPERWLNKIAVHVASHYHDRAHHRREELTGKPMAVVDPTPDAAASMEAIGTRTRVLDALMELDPELRYLLVAHDIDEIPMVELAEAAGLPLSTLYRRRARALDALRDALERREAEEARMTGRPRRQS